jgi:hypothetical protein
VWGGTDASLTRRGPVTEARQGLGPGSRLSVELAPAFLLLEVSPRLTPQT